MALDERVMVFDLDLRLWTVGARLPDLADDVLFLNVPFDFARDHG